MNIGILGGGLAGLTVASQIKNHDCEVLEADPVIGGHCRSLVEDGYTFDVGGPHIIYSKNAEVLATMREMLSDNLVERERVNKIWFKGRYVKYPFENGLGDLDPQDRYECVWGAINACYMPTEPKATNFREWIYRSSGVGMAEAFMLPYNTKIWNCDPAEMATDWCEGRVPQAPLYDIVRSACGVPTEGYTHQLNYCYPKVGGIEALPRAFAEKCANVTTGFPIYHVGRHRPEDKWTVTDGKQMRQFDRLISTLPIRSLIDSLGNGTHPHVPLNVREAARDLRVNSLVTVMIGADAEAGFPFLAIFVPDPEIVFHRVSSTSHIVAENAPEGKCALTVEMTVDFGQFPSDDDIWRDVFAGLVKMGLVNDDFEPSFLRIHRTRNAYVVPTHGHRERLKTCLDFIDSLGIVSVGRNAQHEYINMDETIRRGLEVAAEMDRVEVAV